MKKIITANQLIKKIKSKKDLQKNVKIWRNEISNIIQKKDNKLLVVIWPCSIHNTDETIDYAKRLLKIKKKFPNLFLVMRTYFEKPRTTIWWKGLINDPELNWTFDIEKWLKKARKLLVKITELWLPVATEFLDIITPNYLSDLITWWAIWARTTESQLHRELASNLNTIIWFKNATSGDIQVAIDAIIASSNSHTFLWINLDNKVEITKSNWNDNCHIILRWWKDWPNYDEKIIDFTIEKLKKENISTWIMIDVSHWNSNKNPENQPKVVKDIAKQLSKWNKDIIWVMIESNIFTWNQCFKPWVNKINDLKYGISITDWCIWFKETIKMLNVLNKSIENRKEAK